MKKFVNHELCSNLEVLLELFEMRFYKYIYFLKTKNDS